MQINIENLISITDANQNFSKVARLVDKNGAVIILKNNCPRYIILEYKQISEEINSEQIEIVNVCKRILKHHFKAFQELAK